MRCEGRSIFHDYFQIRTNNRAIRNSGGDAKKKKPQFYESERDSVVCYLYLAGPLPTPSSFHENAIAYNNEIGKAHKKSVTTIMGKRLFLPHGLCSRSSRGLSGSTGSESASCTTDRHAGENLRMHVSRIIDVDASGTCV